MYIVYTEQILDFSAILLLMPRGTTFDILSISQSAVYDNHISIIKKNQGLKREY